MTGPNPVQSTVGLRSNKKVENITNFSFNTNVTQAVRNFSVENKSVDRTSTVRITYAYCTRIAVATLSGNSLGQTVHTYCALFN